MRATDSIRPIASSATDAVATPGVLQTTTPLRVHSATSTLSTPVPATEINFSCGAAASTAESKRE